jgi:hypothetical protein
MVGGSIIVLLAIFIGAGWAFGAKRYDLALWLALLMGVVAALLVARMLRTF